jgi:putative ABC transport system permease protein
MLSLKLLWRNLRSGEVRVLAISLILAVSVVSCISLFTDRLERSLIQESHTFLGADRVIKSSQAIPESWLQQARESEVRAAKKITFASMVFAKETMYLASIKAVTKGYPLVGQLTIADVAFSYDSDAVTVTDAIPEAGTAWVDSRLLPLLNIELGETVFVGEKELQVTKVIVHEPDSGSSFSVAGARLLMNALDLPETEIIQPGSRVSYQLMLAGKASQIDSLIDNLSPQLGVHQQIVDIESAQQGLSKTLTTARKFLLIAAVVGVLLGGIAIAITARRFAVLQIDQVALLKSLGARSNKIRRLYFFQLLYLSLVTSGVGLLIGHFLQELIAISLSELFTLEIQNARLQSYLLGVFTGLVCLLFFVMPPLWMLPSIPPIKILRRELDVGLLKQYWQFILGLLAIVLLIIIFSQDLLLAAGVILALTVLFVCSGALALTLMYFGGSVGRRAGSVWRLGVAALERNKQHSLIQMLVFALAIMLLLTMLTLRTSLLDEWRLQLPEGTPNHFLLNIDDAEVSEVEAFFVANQVETKPLYPMIRARLTHINGELPSAGVQLQAEALRREVNLSWVETLAQDNAIVAGSWWDDWQSKGDKGVSIEQDIANKLGVGLGDELTFSVGGLSLQARVASIRTLKWDSMSPNFYFLFSPNALDEFYPTYLTSVYLSASQKILLNDLLQSFPTLLVIEMDRVIEQIQVIVSQVSFGVELVLVLVLLGGFLVMWASVSASMDERLQEAALLRAFGSSRKRLLNSLWVEFSILGGCAGLMAAFGAEVLLLSFQYWVLKMPIALHWFLWPLGVVGGILIVGSMGVYACRKVTFTPPARILRDVNS